MVILYTNGKEMSIVKRGFNLLKTNLSLKKENLRQIPCKNCIKKIMNYSIDEIDCSVNPDFNIGNYLIRNCKFLTEKLKLGLPILFVINKSKK